MQFSDYISEISKEELSNKTTAGCVDPKGCIQNL